MFYGGPLSATYPVAYVDGMIPSLGQDVFFRSRENINPWQEQYHSLIANIAGKFEGDVVTHNVVLGTEQGWLISDEFVAAQSIPNGSDPTTWLAIDATDPIYNNPNFGLPNPATPFLFDSIYSRESARRLRAGPGRRGRTLEDSGRRALRSCGYLLHPRDRHPADSRSDRDHRPIVRPRQPAGGHRVSAGSREAFLLRDV